MVRDESELDDFDLCFAAHFRGRAEELAAIEREVWEWLEGPAPPYAMNPEWRRVLDAVDVDALRAQFVYTEDGLRRALEDELRIRELTPIVGDVEPAVAALAGEIGVEVNPRFGTWEEIRVVPGTGSISVPAG